MLILSDSESMSSRLPAQSVDGASNVDDAIDNDSDSVTTASTLVDLSAMTSQSADGRATVQPGRRKVSIYDHASVSQTVRLAARTVSSY